MKALRKTLHEPHLPAYTTTELLVVLVIIGILVMLAIPNFMGMISKARSTEAKMQLEALHNLQLAHFYEFSRYSNELEAIGFTHEKLVTDGGRANYQIEIIEATPNAFKATATAIVDFDRDGVFNVWEIDHDQQLREVIAD